MFSTNYPAYKLFMLLVLIAIAVGLLIVLKKTCIGMIVQAALTHPHMVGALGHNVGRVFMMVFGVGTALAAVAGVIAGPALVTNRVWRIARAILSSWSRSAGVRCPVRSSPRC